MATETKTAVYMREQGFTVLLEKQADVTITGRLQSVLTCMDRHKEFVPAVDSHKQRIADFYNGSQDAHWTGGTAQDLRDDLEGRIDMRPFEKAKQKFEQSSLSKKLKERFEKCQPRRTRVKSEYDGEFNESRRWDITPFDGVKKAPGFGRAIDVIVYGSVSAQVDAKELDAYGNTVWALVDIIEQSGCNARVVTRYQQSDYTQGKGGKLVIDVETKKSGEYIAPSLLAATFKSNFFRRAIFQQICLGADIAGEMVGYGLGRPYNREKKIEFNDGQLILAPEVRNASFDEIEKELLKAIG